MPRSILTTYVVWAVLLAFYGGLVISGSDYTERVGEETAQYFKLLFAGGGIVFPAIGGFLAWFTQKERVWAKCMFVVMCGYSAIDAILGPYALSTLTPTIFGRPEWASSLAIALGWAYLAGLACHTRPDQSLQPTSSSVAEFSR